MNRASRTYAGLRPAATVFTLISFVAGACACWMRPALSAENAEAGRTREGIALFQKHHFQQAASAFEADLAHNPADVEAIIYLGRIAFEENRLEAAARWFERATTVAPRSSEAFHWLGRVNGVQARELGAPRGIGAARRTRKALEKAVALDANNLEARVELATYYREAPGIVGGSKRGALAQLEEITRRDPYLGWLVRGDIAMDDKRFSEAEADYKRAINLAPAKSEGHFRLAVLHQRTGRYDDAFGAFEKALQLDPANKTTLFQIGKTAVLSGQRLDRGEAALKEYLTSQPFFIMPKISWAHRRLGDIYVKKGMREAARQQYLAAVRTGPDDKEAERALREFNATGGGSQRR